MKRILALLLTAALVLTAVGCAEKEPEIQSPVAFYYVDATFLHDNTNFAYDGKTTIFNCELREAAGHEKDYAHLLGIYFKRPQGSDLVSPFPRNLEVVDLKVRSDRVYLVLSSNFGQLTGVNLSMAGACIAKTVLSMTGADYVHLSAAGDTLLDGTRQIIMGHDNLLLLDSMGSKAEQYNQP